MPPSDTSSDTANGPALIVGGEPTANSTGGPVAYRVLARKYRPATFASLIGQETMVRTLTNALTSGRLAHAFMLSGVRGIGKTTTARIIARALNCVGADGVGGPTPEPCGVCGHCVAITADRHMDVIEMDAASRTGVDEIRELLDGTRYRPTSARYKIYIIDEVHMLSRNAFNALLKTLEEPPEHVRFVFATTEIRKVPITVLSRCQRFDLRRIDSQTLARHLASIAAREGVSVPEPALHLIARAADGSVRDGLSLLDQAIAHGAGSVDGEAVRQMLGLADRIVTFDLLDAVIRGDIAAALELLAAQYEAGADPVEMLNDMLELTHWLTRIKVVAASVDAPGVPEAERVRGREMAGKLAMAEATRLWQMLLKGLGEVRVAPAPLQAAEMVLIRVAYAARLPTPAEALGGAPTAPAEKPAITRASPAAGQAIAPALVSPAGDTRAVGSSPPPPDPASAPRSHGLSGQASSALAPRPDPDLGKIGEATVTEPADVGTARGLDSFDAVVELARDEREAILYGQLLADVRLVRFEANRIELRLTGAAPGDLVRRLGEFLHRQTGQPWFVTISREDGAPTILERRQRAEAERRREVVNDPLVQAVLAAFPGATLGEIKAIEVPAGVADPEDLPEDPTEDTLEYTLDDGSEAGAAPRAPAVGGSTDSGGGPVDEDA